MTCLAKSHHNLLIVGYTTRRHLCLDLDNTTEAKALKVIDLIMTEYPEVGDCLLIVSSWKKELLELKHAIERYPYVRIKRPCFHLVFCAHIGYNKCVKIIEALAEVGILNQEYVKLRRWRGDMTLRVSPSILTSGVKEAPFPITYIRNKQYLGAGEGIHEYLNFRACVLFALRSDPDPEHQPDYATYPGDDHAEVLAIKTFEDRGDLKG